MRRFFISADLEGCAAVSSQHASAPDRWEWPAARRWMTEEVIVVANAAFESGYNEVIVADSHHNAHNIDPDMLPDNVQLIRSWPRPLLHMQGIELEGVQVCAFIGYHACSTCPGGILAHTYHGGAFREIKLNGETCSEGYLNAALAGELGRAVVLISGDQHTVEDARRYAPEAVGFLAKHAIGWRTQMSLPPAQVQRQLKQASMAALAKAVPAPFVIPGPYRLELLMTTQTAAEMLTYLPGVNRVGAAGVEATFETIRAVTSFVSFAMLYSPTGVIAL